MKKSTKRLSLSSDTLRALTTSTLVRVAGAAPPGVSTDTLHTICRLTYGETYCYSICVGGSGCEIE